MGEMSKFLIVLLVALLIVAIVFAATPFGRSAWNRWFHSVQKADDETSYTTKRQVEDTCRAMISSYESDRLTYLQYKDSDMQEARSWAEQAKMRANKTASEYNNFILKNSYVWSGNVPEDILNQLSYIE